MAVILGIAFNLKSGIVITRGRFGNERTKKEGLIVLAVHDPFLLKLYKLKTPNKKSFANMKNFPLIFSKALRTCPNIPLWNEAKRCVWRYAVQRFPRSIGSKSRQAIFKSEGMYLSTFLINQSINQSIN